VEHLPPLISEASVFPALIQDADLKITITVTLSVALYEHETWHLNLRTRIRSIIQLGDEENTKAYEGRNRRVDRTV
jgi:hypothetical protein